jgi:hypothetical protein
MGPERFFYEGRQRTKQTERQPRIVADLIKLNTSVIDSASGALE